MLQAPQSEPDLGTRSAGYPSPGPPSGQTGGDEVVAIRRELQRLRILAESAPAILLDRDLEKGTVWWNAVAYEMFGVYRQQAETDPRWWVERIHPDDREVLVRQLQTLMNGQTSRLRIEMKMRAGDGYYRTLDARFTALTATGETNDQATVPPARLVVVMRDITPQRRAEHQRDRLFTLSPDLMAVIGMDGKFRQLNPAWESALGVSIDRLLPGRFTDLLHPEDAPTAFRQLRNIVSGLPPQDFECRCVRPDDAEHADASVRWYSFRIRAELSQGNFHLRGKEITFARQALEAAVANKNAAQVARDEAFARLLQLQSDLRSAAGRILTLTPKLISAQIPGVQQLYVDQIENTGHSLLQLAELPLADTPSSSSAEQRPIAPSPSTLQPDIVPESQPLETVQASIQALSSSLSGPPPEAQARIEASAKRILVVEDNLVNQKVAARLLKSQGYAVDLASNGLEALAALDRFPFDLVLMDCQMPEMDGFTATQELRRREQAIRLGEAKAPANSSYAHAENSRFEQNDSPHTPIIAVTAHALSGDREKCLYHGMDDYLMKPINALELRAMVQKALSSVTRRPEAPKNVAPQTVDSQVSSGALAPA
ncbi:MAG: response regulator [Acidobacteriota bacterium]